MVPRDRYSRGYSCYCVWSASGVCASLGSASELFPRLPVQLLGKPAGVPVLDRAGDADLPERIATGRAAALGRGGPHGVHELPDTHICLYISFLWLGTRALWQGEPDWTVRDRAGDLGGAVDHLSLVAGEVSVR